MQGNSIDILFPSRVIESLRNLRGERWENLISSLIDLEPMSPDRIALVLMMVKIGGCTSCQSDSFRSMRGCMLCSNTTIKRYKGSDQTLLDLYNDAKKDVNKYMKEVTNYDG
ncbi:MAG: hypothetical protein A2Y53_02795 [Chloroflexi bacterium RBG_16_47_49]|nr:MAG: hypothetical protein A2Y53_02795 [Chloroflexi bacterium RBG_16_47_49]